MQQANAATVLGDFADQTFTYHDITSRFFRRDDTFYVNTDGPDGKLADYPIKYTFGVDPLQQYLVEFPGGRLQALSLAWDARPEQQGGQRWFHLYPDEQITHADALHWTRPSQNWNTMCAECHSTHLEKNYDPAARTFNTTWSEIECLLRGLPRPGIGPRGVGRAQTRLGKACCRQGAGNQLEERKNIEWNIDPESGNPVRVGNPRQ